jgi:hypothetical protein
VKKIFDVSTIHEGKTFKEVIYADTADEAFEIILNKYNGKRLASIRERKNP